MVRASDCDDGSPKYGSSICLLTCETQGAVAPNVGYCLSETSGGVQPPCPNLAMARQSGRERRGNLDEKRQP
jgi:hypothetical protein